jgi:hypothetical protein
MAVGGQPGNQNGAKAKVWQAAILRALAHRSKLEQKDALDRLAEVLLVKCEEGDMEALKELGNRLEGKPHQSISGEDGAPITISVVTYASAIAEKGS